MRPCATFRRMPKVASVAKKASARVNRRLAESSGSVRAIGWRPSGTCLAPGSSQIVPNHRPSRIAWGCVCRAWRTSQSASWRWVLRFQLDPRADEHRWPTCGRRQRRCPPARTFASTSRGYVCPVTGCNCSAENPMRSATSCSNWSTLS